MPSIDASNVPLSLANLFLPPDRRLSGTVSELTVQAIGTDTQSPDLIASVNLDKPAVTVTTPAAHARRGGRLKPSTAWTASAAARSRCRRRKPGATGKVLAVTDLAAFKGGKRLATLSGTLPVSFGGHGRRRAAIVPTDQPLHAELQVADLAVLSLFGPGRDGPEAHGRRADGHGGLWRRNLRHAPAVGAGGDRRRIAGHSGI